MSRGIFNGDNLVISGGTYIFQNNVTTETDRAIIPQPELSVARTHESISFDILAGKAFPLAFHLADTNRSHSTCFPNTRTNILERIKAWALRSAEKDKFIVWLHGAAGGGKTAIARTFANWCDGEQGILLGEFFFSRADGGSNQFTSIAPTVAFRMAVHTLKDAKDEISRTISQDPHIFLAPLAHQLKKLVLEPLDVLAPNGITPHVIILDGLDETLTPDEQEKLLDIISTTVYQHNSTLRILICSRTEPAIVTAFNDDDSPLKDISTIISLNNDVDSDADIRRFLVERFAKIKKQLPYPPKGEWPTRDNIDYLVGKSSGQFIFAATVEKYVGSPQHRHLAIARLKHVLDLSTLQDPTKYPFTDLDALYSLILSTRSDDKLSARAMAVCIQYPKYFGVISPQNLANVLQIEEDEVFPILYELGSLLDVGENYIRLFHASFGDFLYDKSRSHDLCCVEGDIVADIAFSALGETSWREGPSYHTTYCLMADATPRQDLRDILAEIGPNLIFGRFSTSRLRQGSYYLIPLLRQIKIHISPDVYKSFVTYFDDNFRRLLLEGSGTTEAFKCPENWRYFFNQTTRAADVPDTGVDADLDSISDDESAIETDLLLTGRIITHLAPLVRSSAWDGVREQVKTSLVACPSALRGLCDETDFVRCYLPKTSSTILRKWSPESDAIFCLGQMALPDINEDIRVAFANLLSTSLLFTVPSSELTKSIEYILAQPMICQTLPSDTIEAINQYMEREAAVTVRADSLTPHPTQNETDAKRETPPVTPMLTKAGHTLDTPSPPYSSADTSQPEFQPPSVQHHVPVPIPITPPDAEAIVPNTSSHTIHEVISVPQPIKKGKRRRSPDKEQEDVPTNPRRPIRSCRNPKPMTNEPSVTSASSDGKRKRVEESDANVNKKRKWKGYAIIDETTGEEVFSDVDEL